MVLIEENRLDKKKQPGDNKYPDFYENYFILFWYAYRITALQWHAAIISEVENQS